MSTHRPPVPRKLATAAVWIAAVACLGTGTGFAEEIRLGTLRGRFVVAGELPGEPPAWAESPRDYGNSVWWRRARHTRDSMVIDPRTRAVSNVIVFLRRPPTSVAVAEEGQPEEAVIHLRDGRLWPHAVKLHTGQPVRLVIEDPGLHKIYPRPFLNPIWHRPPLPGDFKVHTFRYDRPEFLPIVVRCDFNPRIVGYWLILDHPYSAVSDEQGRFEIKDLPEGEYDFIVWHERVGYLDKRVDAVDRAFKLRLKPGRNDLGDIEIPAEVFEPRH